MPGIGVKSVADSKKKARGKLLETQELLTNDGFGTADPLARGLCGLLA